MDGENIVDLNIPNTITITLMVLGTLFVAGLVFQLVKRIRRKPAAAEASA